MGLPVLGFNIPGVKKPCDVCGILVGLRCWTTAGTLCDDCWNDRAKAWCDAHRENKSVLKWLEGGTDDWTGDPVMFAYLEMPKSEIVED